jgi:hypothetical protein
MQRTVTALDITHAQPTSDALLTAAAQDPPDDKPLDSLVRRVLLTMLEERRTRQPDSADVRDAGPAVLAYPASR